MGRVAKLHCAVLFVMILALGVSPVLPVEDVLESVYDESETQPLESTLLFSSAVVQAPTRTPQPLLKLGYPSHWGSLTRRDGTRAKQKEQSIHPVSDSVTILDHSLRC